jgi:hypothetical protein
MTPMPHNQMSAEEAKAQYGLAMFNAGREAARREENEACALAVEDMLDEDYSVFEIAAAIRARVKEI